LAVLMGLAFLAALAARPVPSQSDRSRAGEPQACDPATPFTVTATQSGSDLMLSWPDSEANWYYDIYHGVTPDFVPAAANKLDSIHSVGYDGTLTWVNSWALLVTADLYFVVRAHGCAGSTVDSDSTAADKDDPSPPGVALGPEHTGEAPYDWETDGSGNCLFPPTPGDVMVAALATHDYGDDARRCGATARVQGPYGS